MQTYRLIVTCFSIPRNSQVPPFGFVVHVGIYCWYHSSDVERKNRCTAYFMTEIIRETMKQAPRRCRNFLAEVIYPALGPSPARAISRILTKDRSLTDTILLNITMGFVAQLMATCPYMVDNAQSAEILLMAMATITQRYLCQYHEPEEYEPYPPDELLKKRSQINLAIFHTIW